ncbi:MAG TPA: energy transducer TonB [Bryobacteraceae bacterium]|nr:energy transducer TonB [Bryobacteraceae bacterium]
MIPLPGPPAISTTPAPAAIPPVVVRQRPCCIGTAFLEPAKPARLKRLFRRLPGLGRIGQPAEAEEGFTAAKPAREISLVLPPEARASLPDGRMDLKASVDESGRVTRVELLSPKDEELVRLASYAASDWPFKPARLNDKAVPSEVILHFNFGN